MVKIMVAVLVGVWAACARAEVVFEEDFDALAPGTSLGAAPGWTICAGDIKVSDGTALGKGGVDGGLSPAGAVSRACRAFRRAKTRKRLTLTFTARASAGSHNSGVGFARLGDDGTATDLVTWTYGNGHWQLDARGITISQPGQRDRFLRIYAGGADETVTCRIVVDAGGHWVYGSVTDDRGEVHRSRVFDLPAASELLAAAVLISQDTRPESGAIDVDDIRVTSEDPPPLTMMRREMPITITELGWTSPDTKYLHDNVAEMERRPLDGVTVRVANPRFPHGNLLYGTGKGEAGWQAFQNRRLTREIIEPAIADLATARFKRFDSNFVAVITYLPGRQTMDWFDDEWWDNIAHNAALLAEVAQKGGCRGIMFDPEEYGCRFWSSVSLREDPLYEGKTHDEVVAKVRQRGGEFMRAVNSAYPGVHIYILHAWEDALSNFADDAERLAATRGRGLVVTFLDGMLEASDDDTLLMDGIENGYYIEDRVDFLNKVDRVLRYGPGTSAVPDRFRKKVRTGFGIWVDRNQHWDPVHLDKNFWTPEKLRKVVANALAASDGFVWIYTERVTFWLDSPDAKPGGGIDLGTGVGDYAYRNQQIKWMPRAYWNAIEDARQDALAERQRERTGDE